MRSGGFHMAAASIAEGRGPPCPMDSTELVYTRRTKTESVPLMADGRAPSAGPPFPARRSDGSTPKRASQEDPDDVGRGVSDRAAPRRSSGDRGASRVRQPDQRLHHPDS